MTIALVWPVAAGAQTKLSVDAGWDGVLRLGRWNPLFVTASDPSPRQVILEITAPHDKSAGLCIRQRATIGPKPATFAILLPLQCAPDEIVVSVREDASERTLAWAPLQDAKTPALRRKTLLAESTSTVGISGNPATAAALASQIRAARFAPGFLETDHLSDVAIGYDSLDVLVLSAADLSQITPTQQEAIIAWVRAGGILVLWPGDAPLPYHGPITDALPGKFGQTWLAALSASDADVAGIDVSATSVQGRLFTPDEDARTIPLFDHPQTLSTAAAYGRRLGFGEIRAVNVDLAQIAIRDASAARAVWANVLDGLITPPINPPDAVVSAYGATVNVPLPPELAGAESSALGPSQRTAAVGLLLGACLLIGPVDSWVLWKLARPGRRWTTIVGWLGLLATGAVMAVGVPVRQPIPCRAVQMIDQADNRVVATTIMLSIPGDPADFARLPESATSKAGWWQPVGAPSGPNDQGMLSLLPFHQGQEGNRLLPEPFAPGTALLLRRDDLAPPPPAPGLVTASLTLQSERDGPHLRGTLTNPGPATLDAMAIYTADAHFDIPNPLPPGKSREIDLHKSPALFDSAPLPSQATPADRRTRRLVNLHSSRPDLAILYAQVIVDPSSTATAPTAGDCSMTTTLCALIQLPPSLARTR
jgi:hypothetical protein